MTGNGVLQIVVYFGILLLLARPLGIYMARVYEGDPSVLTRLFGPVERFFYKFCGINPDEEMGWKRYTAAVLVFGAAGFLVLYLLQRFQGALPFNPQKLPSVAPGLAFNTAVSFVTNTNWQNYGGETTMSYLTQMAGLGVQNFVSAATGMAVLVALVRGFKRHSAQTIGNFWVDLTRSTFYILLPLSVVWSLLLVSQGVVQTLSEYKTVSLTQAISYEKPKLDDRGNPVKDARGNPATERVHVKEQVIPFGPAASQIAIKQLGTNGGGFFNVNSAHPFENPTALSNFLEVLAILLIPAALCLAFGKMIGDLRQGWALLAAMSLVLVSFTCWCAWNEQGGNPRFGALGIDQTASESNPGGNMEGKEARFGIVNSALWATATTAASNGSVNAMHDSFTPVGGMVPLCLMQLGEVIFGGVGSGLYGMLVFAIITVFIAGLMVGRTPEYLGKKIEMFEMKMASLAILIVNALVTIGTAFAVSTKAGVAGIANPGPHGFSEVLYAFSSAANNNGSAFAGLTGNAVFYHIALGIAMFIGRFWVIIPVLAIAGSLAKKKHVPAGLGTLPTHTPLFVAFLIGVVLIVGALTFVPSLALGPIAEQFMAAR
ncbi:MAG: potassium-transporting ATPase subunit KdpA [Deltaproteobacteria bacterium]|nr:potassium-transporting ATPase subunit KdpA [Deltaproteobacteria bacterium]